MERITPNEPPAKTNSEGAAGADPFGDSFTHFSVRFYGLILSRVSIIFITTKPTHAFKIPTFNSLTVEIQRYY